MAKRKLSVSTLINLVLGVTVVVLVGFGYYYWKGVNPVENVSNNIPLLDDVPEYEYDFAIYGGEKDFKNPYEVVAFSNSIYVSDTGNSRIVKFDNTGRFQKEIKHKDLSRPNGMFWDGQQLWVADSGKGLVVVFDADGNYVRTFKPQTTGAFADVVVNENKVYLLNNSKMAVQAYNLSDGKLANEFGKAGDKPGELYYPYTISMNDDKLYVADSLNKRINVYDFNGKLLDTLPKKIDDDPNSGILNVPRGIVFDKKGRLFTVEGVAHKVTVLDDKSQIFLSFNKTETIGEEVQDMNLPTDVTFDENGRLLVLEFGFKRVLVYKAL